MIISKFCLNTSKNSLSPTRGMLMKVTTRLPEQKQTKIKISLFLKTQAQPIWPNVAQFWRNRTKTKKNIFLWGSFLHDASFSMTHQYEAFRSEMVNFSTFFSTSEAKTNHSESGRQNASGDWGIKICSPGKVIIQRIRCVEVRLEKELSFPKSINQSINPIQTS